MIPALLTLALLVILAFGLAVCAADSRPDDQDVDPAPLPAPRTSAELFAGAHAAPVGTARVPVPGVVLTAPDQADPPTDRPYVSRHGYAGEPLYRKAFAAQVGAYDPSCYRCALGDPCSGQHETAAEVFGIGAAAVRPGRGSDR